MEMTEASMVHVPARASDAMNASTAGSALRKRLQLRYLLADLAGPASIVTLDPFAFPVLHLPQNLIKVTSCPFLCPQMDLRLRMIKDHRRANSQYRQSYLRLHLLQMYLLALPKINNRRQQTSSSLLDSLMIRLRLGVAQGQASRNLHFRTRSRLPRSQRSFCSPQNHNHLPLIMERTSPHCRYHQPRAPSPISHLWEHLPLKEGSNGIMLDVFRMMYAELLLGPNLWTTYAATCLHPSV
jgi:hypothetical protein